MKMIFLQNNKEFVLTPVSQPEVDQSDRFPICTIEGNCSFGAQ